MLSVVQRQHFCLNMSNTEEMNVGYRRLHDIYYILLGLQREESVVYYGAELVPSHKDSGDTCWQPYCLQRPAEEVWSLAPHPVELI